MTAQPDDKKGFFIVLDGLEGSGKSTQIQALKQRLEAAGYSVIRTREPGGSPGAEHIRGILLSGDAERWDGVSELMLFTAGRRNHVETTIKPALAEGKIVLCDRFVSSTIALQGYGRGMSLDTIKHLTKIAIGDFEPDLTFLFFIDPALGLRRAASRNGTEMRFESLGLEFHQRVYDGFKYALDKGNHGIVHSLHKYLPVEIKDNTDLSAEEQIAILTDFLFYTITKRMNRDRPWLSRYGSATQHQPP